jgi:hypothetical protein
MAGLTNPSWRAGEAGMAIQEPVPLDGHAPAGLATTVRYSYRRDWTA